MVIDWSASVVDGAVVMRSSVAAPGRMVKSVEVTVWLLEVNL